MKNFGEKEAWAYPAIAQFFRVAAPGTRKGRGEGRGKGGGGKGKGYRRGKWKEGEQGHCFSNF